MLTTVVEIQSKNAMHLSVQTSVSILVSLRSARSAAKEAHITSQNATQCAIPLPCLAPWALPGIELCPPFLAASQRITSLRHNTFVGLREVTINKPEISTHYIVSGTSIVFCKYLGGLEIPICPQP